MTIETLVRPLFAGPLDIVGDVHGEIDALATLLRRLGYAADGVHPEGRRLAFVGDLVDRGPDSPAVIELVSRLVEQERAQCVLGNHELNILLGSHKPDNTWFFHHELSADHAVRNRPEARADARTREKMLRFFGTLPLALERSDVRIVHACWDNGRIALARQGNRAEALYRAAQAWIAEQFQGRHPDDVKLAQQNENPVKLLTSGPEEKADKPYMGLDGKEHDFRRVIWWRDYDGPLCVFGHYWRILLPGEVDNDRLFTGVPRNALLGRGHAMCVDYSVGKRFKERAAPGFTGVFRTQLAALRWPERVLVFDQSEPLSLLDR